MTKNNSFEQTSDIQPAGEQIRSKRPVWILYLGLFLVLSCLLVVVIGGATYIITTQLGQAKPGIAANPQDSTDRAQPTIDPALETAHLWHLLFLDDFSIDDNRWDTGQLITECMRGSRQIEGGKYHIELEGNDGCVSWEYPEISPVSDFYISMDARQTTGSPAGAYGLVLRNSGANYYFFLINNHGAFDFERLYADNFNPLIEWVASPAIQKNGVNRLSVIARGPHFSLYINNQLVGQIDDDKLTIGSAGIMVSYEKGTKLGFDFDNFEIRAAPGQSPTGASLTPTAPAAHAPVSAIGHIVFAANKDGRYSIYTVKADGNELTRLTDGKGNDFSPAWSPDGKKIAFTSTREGNADIFVMNADGSDQKKLTQDTEEDTSPKWSPDGKQIAFVSTRQGSHDIYLIDADGSNPKALTDDPGDEAAPAWAPDGTKIAFQANNQSKIYNIYTMKPDGSRQYQVTYYQKYCGEPTWSPDGKLLTFVSDREGNQEIYVKGSTANDQKNLTNNPWDDFSPTWSPDGKWIAFVSIRDGKKTIYIMQSSGSNVQALVDMPGDQQTPSWISN
jgi:hypothetical protein